MLEEVLYYMIEGSLRYPGVSLAHVHGIIVEKRTDTLAADAFRQIFDTLADHATQAFPDVQPAPIRAGMTHILSSALFTMLAPDLFLPSTPLDLHQPEGQRKLARYLTRLLAQSLTIPVEA
jgi:hypothetical protein